MNAYERMTMALAHRQADRVPVLPILSGITRKLIGASYPQWSTDATVCADAFLQATKQFSMDCVVTLIDLSIECDAWGQKILYPPNEAAHPDFQHCVIQEISDYSKIRKVDYRTSKRMCMHIDVCKQLVTAKKGEIPLVAFVFGPLGVLSMLRGQEALYTDFYDDPDAVQGAVQQINETLKEYVAALCDAGMDAIMFDTLFASGTIMSKDMWRQMESQAVRELSDLTRSKGRMVMAHNCGQKPYFDAQIEAMNPDAISFLYPPDDCVDFAACKKKYGQQITLIGCVTPANAVIGTDEEWDAQCRDQIYAMAEGGGFVLATGCEYPANATFDRAERMIEIAKTDGIYKS